MSPPRCRIRALMVLAAVVAAVLAVAVGETGPRANEAARIIGMRPPRLTPGGVRVIP